ncbi:MAG TPA: four helix bundle protein [Puia sp.]|jgi:four helix bundle protein
MKFALRNNIMRNYQNYEVWGEAHRVVLLIYNEIAPRIPRIEQFGITSQMKRAACSVPLNIAEGCGRNSENEFVHFLDISLGSAHELEYCLLLAKDLGYLEIDLYDQLNRKVNSIKAMLINLIKLIRLQGTKGLRP